MKEIGGYFQLEQFKGEMLHQDAIALNSGRNCLAYLIRSRKIEEILIPRFLCDSIEQVCRNENIKVDYYSIDEKLLPCNISLKDNQWLYFVNYYGQFSNELIREVVDKYQRVIVDNVQAYFQSRIDGVDTIYTCRKFFGVPDGAFLYTDAKLTMNLEQDISHERMSHVLGRFESSATEFYGKYSENEDVISNLPLMRMSRLTENLLRGIDYQSIKEQRTKNFETIHSILKNANILNVSVPNGAFMYPLYVHSGAKIRQELQTKRIFIPTLWPDVFNICSEKELEYDMAKNILPIPIDQRYNEQDMKYIAEEILKCIN